MNAHAYARGNARSMLAAMHGRTDVRTDVEAWCGEIDSFRFLTRGRAYRISIGRGVA